MTIAVDLGRKATKSTDFLHTGQGQVNIDFCLVPNKWDKVGQVGRGISTPLSFDQDRARHSLGPDLGPNCLQRLSADDKLEKYLLSINILLWALPIILS